MPDYSFRHRLTDVSCAPLAVLTGIQIEPKKQKGRRERGGSMTVRQISTAQGRPTREGEVRKRERAANKIL